MATAAAEYPDRLVRCVAALVLLTGCTLAGCRTDNAAPTTSTSATTAVSASSDDTDKRQLRELYTRLLSALSRHDAAEQIALTCAKYQDEVQRREDSDPFLQIDFFGPPEQLRQLGVGAATDKLLTGLAPASREAVRAVAQAIINGDVAQYRTAIQRVEQEGTFTTLDRIDRIEIASDTATVAGSFTVTIFTNPPKVVDSSSTAIRENGRWTDCTPPTHQQR